MYLINYANIARYLTPIVISHELNKTQKISVQAHDDILSIKYINYNKEKELFTQIEFSKFCLFNIFIYGIKQFLSTYKLVPKTIYL